MALDVRPKPSRSTAGPECAALEERAAELREWLQHLESWVESRMAATDALVALVGEGEDQEEPAAVSDGKKRDVA